MFKKAIPKLFFSNFEEVMNGKKEKKYKFFAFFIITICFTSLALAMVYSSEYIRENIKPPWVFESWMVYIAMMFSFSLVAFVLWYSDNFKCIFENFISITLQSVVFTYLSCNLTNRASIHFVILLLAWVIALYVSFLALTDTKIKFNGYSFMVGAFLVALNIVLERDWLCMFNQVLDFWKGG